MLGYTDAQFTELMRLYLTIHRWARSSNHGHQVSGLVGNFSSIIIIWEEMIYNKEIEKCHKGWFKARSVPSKEEGQES
jgi:hypothetical protein